MFLAMNRSVLQRVCYPHVRRCTTFAKKPDHALKMRERYKIVEAERSLKFEADFHEDRKQTREYVIRERDRLLNEMAQHLVFPYEGEIHSHKTGVKSKIAELLRKLGYKVEQQYVNHGQTLLISLPPEN